MAGAILYGPAGTMEGVHEAVSRDFEDVDTGWFTTVTIGEFTLGGAATGMLSGRPLAAAIGAGIG